MQIAQESKSTVTTTSKETKQRYLDLGSKPPQKISRLLYLEGAIQLREVVIQRQNLLHSATDRL